MCTVSSDTGGSKDSLNVVPYAVGGSLIIVMVIVVVVILAIIGYLRWKAYVYRVQPKMQGAATPLSKLNQ